jgi:hypothetical protein
MAMHRTARTRIFDLAVALKHTDTLKVDWDLRLTERETQFVLGNLKYFRMVARTLSRDECCQVCGEGV